MLKKLPANTGDVREADSVPAFERRRGEGDGSPAQRPCRENPSDQGAGGAGVTESDTTEAAQHTHAADYNELICTVRQSDLMMPAWASQAVPAVKNPPANAGDMRRRFDPWIRKILAWRTP